MTSPVNTLGRRISLAGVHGSAEIWGKQIPKVINLDSHAPAYHAPRWVARLTRTGDEGYPLPEVVEAENVNDMIQVVCAWFRSIGDGMTVQCSWIGTWDTTLTREENVRAHGGRYDRPAPDEPWAFWVMGISPPDAPSEGPPAPRRRERTRLPMKTDPTVS